MIKIDIKPLSVNKAYNSYCNKCRSAKHVRRSKTNEYKAFKKILLMILPKDFKVPSGKLKIVFEWGFSSPLSDWDNPIKMTQDILQEKYKFNDRMVFDGRAKKEIVKKGEEYIKFEITEL